MKFFILLTLRTHQAPQIRAVTPASRVAFFISIRSVAPSCSIISRPFASFADPVLHLHQLAPTCINLHQLAHKKISGIIPTNPNLSEASRSFASITGEGGAYSLPCSPDALTGHGRQLSGVRRSNPRTPPLVRPRRTSFRPIQSNSDQFRPKKECENHLHPSAPERRSPDFCPQPSVLCSAPELLDATTTRNHTPSRMAGIIQSGDKRAVGPFGPACAFVAVGPCSAQQSNHP
jgi:hypothetical protein